MFDLYSQLAYSLKASDVQTVVIGGRIVMRDKKLLTLNEPEILSKAREYGTKVKSSLGLN
jgi:5-methylthioadenosine/S-adenosylhomocysteine deaminase